VSENLKPLRWRRQLLGLYEQTERGILVYDTSGKRLPWPPFRKMDHAKEVMIGRFYMTKG
jgi:hypothetical protein